LFGGYLGQRDKLLAGKADRLPGGEWGQGYEDIVSGVDPEYFFGGHLFSPAFCRGYRLNVALNVSMVKPATIYLL
jgi:hypothetical protein